MGVKWAIRLAALAVIALAVTNCQMVDQAYQWEIDHCGMPTTDMKYLPELGWLWSAIVSMGALLLVGVAALLLRRSRLAGLVTLSAGLVALAYALYSTYDIATYCENGSQWTWEHRS